MHDISILAIIWISVFIASFLAYRTRLTPVLWYLFCGAVMVNLGLLPKVMPVFITDFAELGIIIIMFALGFEEETENFVGSIKRSWGIAFFGALAPFYRRLFCSNGILAGCKCGAVMWFSHDGNGGVAHHGFAQNRGFEQNTRRYCHYDFCCVGRYRFAGAGGDYGAYSHRGSHCQSGWYIAGGW